MPIKTFRGLLANGAQDTIVLHTNDGSTGYRIKSLRLFPEKFGEDAYESVVQIFKIEQTAVTAVVDFGDNTLLAAGSYSSHPNAHLYADDEDVVFDNEVFNQDIFITHVDPQGNAMNYYIELEQIKLDLSENTVATLKDIRNITQPAV